MKFFLSRMLAACLTLASTISCAQIRVSPVILDFNDGASAAQNVLIQNPDKTTAYIDVTPYVVQHAGTPDESKARVYNPAESGILVSDSRLIIPPQSQRYVRIMMTQKPSDIDKIFRVTFIPKISGLITQQHEGEKDVGLHVIVGYGVLITQRPTTPSPTLEIHKQGKTLTITNKGNTNTLLTSPDMPSHRFYAGNSLTLSLASKKVSTLVSHWPDHTKTYNIDAS